MKRKHIRTVIIAAMVLIAALTALFKISIEPANQQPDVKEVYQATTENQNIKEDMTDTAEAVVSEAEKELSSEEVNEKKEDNAENINTPAPEIKKAEDEKKDGNKKAVSSEAAEIKEENPEDTQKQTEPVNAGAEKKESEQEAVSDAVKTEEETKTEPEQHFCTVEIRCDTVIDTKKLENQAVAPYVPENGIILASYKTPFTPGESVFDVLLRATKEKNIHMEFRDDNTYNGKYIEGINYLYEMDGGPLSGWMYKVNGKFPNYGCAGYEVRDDDAVVWLYTCDLGMDVGDNSTW